ncbi:MAG: sigma 54-interacting transcriptional regulator [Candidatus Competibacter sp.]
MLEKISAADWEVSWAQDAVPARALLTENTFEVGLAILFSCESERAIQWLVDLILARRKMQWVMVLSRQCLERKLLSTIIAEHCYDYHTLPIEPQRLIVTLGHAYGMAMLTENTLRQQRELESQYGLIGNSLVMQTLFRGIQKAAEVDVPVLITGESGTGKEQSARAIHEYSSRAASPFVTMNCAALPVNLIQSELFGHEKGAFSGANDRRIGLIESTNGGTLFLDEIGDLPFRGSSQPAAVSGRKKDPPHGRRQADPRQCPDHCLNQHASRTSGPGWPIPRRSVLSTQRAAPAHAKLARA